MIGATRQLYGAAHYADPTFDPIAKALPFFEPSLLFMPSPLFGLRTGLRQANVLYPKPTGQLFIGGRKQALVARQKARPMAEVFLMVAQDSRQQLLIRRVALCNQLPVADEPVLDFSVIDLMTELSIPRWAFAPAQNLRMRFEQAHHLRRRRDGLLVKDSTDSLIQDLFH